MNSSRFLRLLICICLLLCSTACSGNSESSESSAYGSASGTTSSTVIENDDGSFRTDVYAMNTAMNLKAYGGDAREALIAASHKLYELDQMLSVTNENSQISRLNSRETDAATGDASRILRRSLELSDLTGGAFDLTIYPVVKAWGFTTGEYRVPSEEEIASLLPHVGSQLVSLSGSDDHATVTFSDPETELDVGGIAKGYASDLIYEIFREHDVTSAIVTLGGNVIAYEEKIDGSPWKVAIEDPFGTGSYAGVISVRDRFVITSGGYQRYFDQDGTRYIHIMDPSTGYPVDLDLASVTIVSSDGAAADALSTALFTMGREKAVEFWRSSEVLDFETVLITKDQKVYVTEGIAGDYASEYDDVTTVRR